MIDIAAIIDDDGNLLFDETTGSSSFDDIGIYDSSSGKYYTTLFDLEQAFYDAKIYAAGDLPDPPDIESIKFEPLQMAYKPTEMDIDSLIASVTPTFTQRVDGVWVVGYNVVPNPMVNYWLSFDDLF